MNKKLAGGFSADIIQAQHLLMYLKHNKAPGGYIGHDIRTESRDRIVEEELLRVGLKAGGIATWLTSVDARHFMDGVDETKSDVEFRASFARYAPIVVVMVAVWRHPDFEGTISSRHSIIESLRNAFAGSA